MPLFHTDDQAMLKDMAAPFLAERGGVAELRRLRDADDATGFSPDLWRDLGAQGLAGVLVPEALGGSGLGHVEAGIVLEEIGRTLTPSPFLASAVAAATALAGADAELSGRWLPRIAGGAAVAAVAIDEGTKHRPAAIAMRAERVGNGFRLDGVKRFVLHGHAADLIVVAARTSDAGITLFAVERGAAGLSADPVRLADSSLASTLTFDGVEGVALGAVDGGAALLDRVLDAGRAGAASELIGVGGAAIDLTIDYLGQRKQFGRLIGEFQALQHRAAHLHSELEIARAAILKAQQLLDAGDERASLMASVAKAKAGRAAALAVQEGVQMHGGIGMTDAHDIGLYMKRHRVLDELFGDARFHADRVARLNGY